MKQKKTMIICAMATCILSGYAQHQGNTKSELTEKSHELNPVVVTGNGHHEYRIGIILDERHRNGRHIICGREKHLVAGYFYSAAHKGVEYHREQCPHSAKE